VKINDSNKANVNLGVEKSITDKANTAKSGDQKAVNSTESKAADSVTISPMAQKLKSIGSNLAADGAFDANKVNEIKDAIASGQFKVNTDKVADGLIQSVKEMLTNKT